MIDLSSGIIEVDNIKFSLDILIDDFIALFGSRIEDKTVLLDDDNERGYVYNIKDSKFFDIPTSNIAVWFKKGKIFEIWIDPKMSSDVHENYEKCKEWGLEKVGEPTKVLCYRNEEMVFLEGLLYVYNKYKMSISIWHDPIERRLTTQITFNRNDELTL